MDEVLLVIVRENLQTCIAVSHGFEPHRLQPYVELTMSTTTPAVAVPVTSIDMI